MTNIFKLKICLDAALTILMLLSMGYHLADNATHEWIGFCFILSFLFHQILNIKWYKNLKKGRYSKPRKLLALINFLLLLSVIITAISGICMSREVFSFLPRTSHLMLFQHIHMSASSWLFILASCHLGLHWGIFINLFKRNAFLKKIIENQKVKIVLIVAIFLYGIFQFIKRQFIAYMLLLVEYPIFDFYETYFIFLFDYLMIMGACVILFYFLQNFVKVQH